MSSPIRLEVNHGKHVKNQSGQRIIVDGSKAIKNEKKELNSQQQKQTKKQLPPKQKQKNQQITQKNNSKVKNEKKQQKIINQIQIVNEIKINKENQQKQKQKQTNDKQLITLQRIKKQQAKTKITIEQLISQYKDATEDIFINHGHNQQKQRKIKQKLAKLKKQKRQRHLRISQLQKQSMSKSLEKEKKNQEIQQKQLSQEKQKRIIKAQQKIAEIKAKSHQRLQNQIRYQDYRNQYQQKVPRFKRYEMQLKQKQKQIQKDQQYKLSKSKNALRAYKPMTYEETLAYIEQYEHQRWNLISEKQKKRELNQQAIELQNKQLEQKIWRGKVHKDLKQELKEQQKIRYGAKTKLQRTRDYSTIVKDQFRPKINQTKRNRSISISQALRNSFDDDDQTTDGKKYKKVAREKYSNGVSKGIVIQNLRKSLDHNQQWKKGNQYLNQIKSLPKIKKQVMQQSLEVKTEESPKRILKTPLLQIFKADISKNPYYNKSTHLQTLGSRLKNVDAKNPQSVHKMLRQMKNRSKQMNRQQTVIKHGNYGQILDLQEKNSDLNRKIVQDISDKLKILSKM